jgi:hypothetical protein
VLVGLPGQRVAEVLHVLLGGLPPGHDPVLVSEVGLGAVQVIEQLPDLVHGLASSRDEVATLVTLTAVTLYTGCLDTGSHSVRVSSLAAVPGPLPGSCPDGLSK